MNGRAKREQIASLGRGLARGGCGESLVTPTIDGLIERCLLAGVKHKMEVT